MGEAGYESGEIVYAHSYSVDGQILVRLVVFVQSKSTWK